MNIENILNNDDNKLIFLRAILLGINYGKTNKSDYYLQVVENEIGNIINKKNLSKNNIKNHIIDKNESAILQLENQRNNTLTLIQKLSINNYGSNYSKINLLKNNLLLLNKEIERNKIILKKTKQSIVKTPVKENNLVNELQKTLGNLSNMVIN